MKVWTQRFNIYLALAAALILLCGCQTEKPKKPTAALRVHIEANSDTLGTSQAVSVLRADPVLVTIAQEPILTEANLIAARILDAPGGCAIEVRFDETGTWILEQYTAANPGRHLVIFSQWGENLADGRWLAAPLITHRIGNGVLAFTPDMSRLEAEQLVLGLTHVAEFNQKRLK
jgi:preprotein translocase subunit SecD